MQQSQDRRRDDPVLRAIERLQGSFDDRHTENTRHLAELNEKVDRIMSGFPDADPAGHREYHEALIRKAEERAKFWSDLRGKLIERGIFATLVLLGGFLLGGFVVWLKGLVK